MTTFAAIDAKGSIRFVGDVPRGAACGCFCPTCKSPLVARHGLEKIWHFAHEASQERPECVVGSINLLRRLAIEKLSAMPEGLPLPPGTTTVSCSAGWKRFSEALELRWPARHVQVASWSLDATSTQAVAEFALTDGARSHRIGVFVQIEKEADSLQLQEFDGALVFHCPPPGEGQLKSLQDALDYLVKEGDLIWSKLPDFGGAMTRARATVEHQRQRFLDEHEADRLARERSLVEAHNRMRDMSRLKAENRAQLQSTDPAPADLPGWAVWKKHNSSFFAFGMGPGECWVVMAAEDFSGCYIVPIPLAFDGWDETLPPGLAKPMPTRECYTSTLPVSDVNSWFMQRSKLGSRIDSDARVIAAFGESVASQ